MGHFLVFGNFPRWL